MSTNSGFSFLFSKQWWSTHLQTAAARHTSHESKSAQSGRWLAGVAIQIEGCEIGARSTVLPAPCFVAQLYVVKTLGADSSVHKLKPLIWGTHSCGLTLINRDPSELPCTARI